VAAIASAMRWWHFLAAELQGITMALKSITVTKGPAASGEVFAFRVGEKKPNDKKVGKLEIGKQPKRIDLQASSAVEAKLEQVVIDLIGKKYLAEISREEMPEQQAKSR
jgi:hypothetical protein